MSQRRFVLLDRDGTIMVDKPYLADLNAVELIDGAAAGMRALSQLGLGLVVVTNQSAVGRGMLDLENLAEIHGRMVEQLDAEGVSLDGIYFCPHRPEDDCACRKPRPGMAQQAAADLHFTPASGFVIGDQSGDLGLGRAVGATTLLVRTGQGAATAAAAEVDADHVVEGLGEAAGVIGGLLGSDS